MKDKESERTGHPPGREFGLVLMLSDGVDVFRFLIEQPAELSLSLSSGQSCVDLLHLSLSDREGGQ